MYTKCVIAIAFSLLAGCARVVPVPGANLQLSQSAAQIPLRAAFYTPQDAKAWRFMPIGGVYTEPGPELANTTIQALRGIFLSVREIDGREVNARGYDVIVSLASCTSDKPNPNASVLINPKILSFTCQWSVADNNGKELWTRTIDSTYDISWKANKCPLAWNDGGLGCWTRNLIDEQVSMLVSEMMKSEWWKVVRTQ